MYKYIIRPLLFLFSPESIHELVVVFVKFFFRIPCLENFIRKHFTINSKCLEKEFLGLHFKNPVGLAAGFDKNASFFREFSCFGFSHIEIGTVTPEPQPGNPKPRSFRLPVDKALINRMGFNNLGAEKASELLKERPEGLIIGANIGKNTSTPNNMAVNDFAYCFEKLYDYVDYFVINVSCPNIGDLTELQDKDVLLGILTRLTAIRAGKHVKKPVLLKISPDLNFTQIDDTIEIIEKSGIEGIVACNTTVSRGGLVTKKTRIDAIGNGGLSGMPLRERSTEIIRYIKAKTNGRMPVVGVGGIMSAEDAIEKITAGADLIQIYTGFIYEGPGIVKAINKAIIEMKFKHNTGPVK